MPPLCLVARKSIADGDRMVAICRERNQNEILFHNFADSFVDMRALIEGARRGKVQASLPSNNMTTNEERALGGMWREYCLHRAGWSYETWPCVYISHQAPRWNARAAGGKPRHCGASYPAG
jgi:hypothetical protein